MVLWAFLGALGVLLGRFWALLGRSWVALGAILGALGGVLGHAGRSWGLLGCSGVTFGDFVLILLDLCSIFARFLVDLGAILPPQNGAKTLQNRC